MSSKPEVKSRGIQPKRSTVIKLASNEIISAVKQPLPKDPIEAVSQAFSGEAPPPIGNKKKSAIAKSLVNPLLNPLPKLIPTPLPEDATLPEAPIKKKQLKHAKETPDYQPRKIQLDSMLKDLLDKNEIKKEAKGEESTFKKYQEDQTKIESANPYLTDTVIYTPQTRKSFYRFIANNYTDSFKLPLQIKGKLDESACAKLGAAAGQAVESFLYQKFVREYIRNAAPYRGILVYHGLGSGKTCSAIAAAEALYGTSNKKIIVMTPFSLRGNFMSEISFCGFRHFNTQNYWVSEPLISEDGLPYLYARSVLSLSESYLNQVLKRPEDDRKVIWIPDFTKPANYNELSQQDRDDIRAQITNMIENRVTFISYNGITAKKLKEFACKVDPVTGERLFDNAVIVIDEVHNLTRLMQGEITPYTMKRKGRARKIPVEPIVPGKWVPGLCSSDLNYKRSYLFYKLLTDARNSKIIGLSGTPIINFPDELAILANVLSGYTECVEVILNSADKAIIDKVRNIAESESRVDIVRFTAREKTIEVLISVFNEGYERVQNDQNKFVGVKFNQDAQDGIKEVYERIKAKLVAEKVPIGKEQFISYPRLPVDDKEFKDEFIDPVNLSIKNKVVLQKRLTGLISYYKGSKEEYMPRVIKDEVVRCEMSDYVLSMYSVERSKEIKKELTKEESEDKYAAVEIFAKMKNPSSYRFRSRALCNFTFPKGIERPFPDSQLEEEEEVDQVEDVEMGEAETVVEEDLKAQEEVAVEDGTIPDPESDEGEGEEFMAGEEVATARARRLDFDMGDRPPLRREAAPERPKPSFRAPPPVSASRSLDAWPQTSLVTEALKQAVFEEKRSAIGTETTIEITKGSIANGIKAITGRPSQNLYNDEDRIVITSDIMSFATERGSGKAIFSSNGGANYHLIDNGGGLNFANFAGLELRDVNGIRMFNACKGTAISFRNCKLLVNLSNVDKETLDSMKFYNCDLSNTIFPDGYKLKTSAIAFQKSDGSVTMCKVDANLMENPQHHSNPKQHFDSPDEIFEKEVYGSNTEAVKRLTPSNEPSQARADRLDAISQWNDAKKASSWR